SSKQAGSRLSIASNLSCSRKVTRRPRCSSSMLSGSRRSHSVPFAWRILMTIGRVPRLPLVLVIVLHLLIQSKDGRRQLTGTHASVEILIEQLGSRDYGQRERAQQALDAVGLAALADLSSAAENHKDAEVRRRARNLAAGISGRYAYAKEYTKKVQSVV